MKNQILIILLLVLSISAIKTNGQAIITKNDSIPMGQDTIVKIILPEARGNIQWQKLLDTKNWENLETETNDTLLVKSDVEALYRAIVTDGTCLPIYSDSVAIVFNKPNVSTLPVSSVKQFSATLNGNILFNGGTEVMEVGFYLSENIDSIINDLKITADEKIDTFNFAITYLKPATNYYICTFATNSKGTTLGDTVSFVTKDYEYMVFDFREDTIGWDFWVVVNDESNYYVKFNDQKPVSVFFTPDVNKEGYSIFFGDDGLPSKMVVDSFIILFDNYRDGIFDIAVITPLEGIKIFRDVQNNLTVSSTKSLQNLQGDEWLQFAIQTTNNLIGVVTCTAGILSGVGTLPALISCGSTVVGMISQVVPADWEVLGLPIGEILGTLAGTTGGVNGLIKCVSQTDLLACLTTLAKVTLTLESEALEYLNNEKVPTAQNLLQIPTVTTNTILNITQTSASCGGNVISEGGATVSAKGFCWSTSPNPTISNNNTINGFGIGSFTSNLTGLTANTNYYVRAYATNSQGTAYGNEVTFTTGQTITQPSVTTNTITNITQTSATLHGNVTSNGGATITQRGFYWSRTDQTPDSNDNKETVSGTTGTFNKSITGLQTNTKYYCRAYATNNQGTSTGSVKSFTTNQDLSAPTVSTNSATNITETSGTLNGNVTSDGNASITQRGFYWSSTDQTPDSNDNKETVSGTTGSFNKAITGLQTNTTYYYRAYATNSQGTSTGGVQSFSTNQDLSAPTVSTNTATNITENSGTLNGNVTSDGNASITQRGFYWSSTDQTPDSGDNIEAVSGTTGTFNKTVSGLQANTTYYYRAFATNSQGIATGSVQSFKTEGGGVVTGTFTDTRDGKTYKTVTMGNQTWMTENLAYLPSVSPSSAGSATEPYYYVYGYNGTNVSAAKATANYSTYGVLYNWPAAKAACPSGWHLPTDEEWKQMEMAVGMSQSEADDTGWRGTNEGTKLKATSGWYNNGNGTDDYGFSALPGGTRLNNGSFYDVGSYGIWWSATEDGDGSSHAWYRLLYYLSSYVGRSYDYKETGLSVRCIRD